MVGDDLGLIWQVLVQIYAFLSIVPIITYFGLRWIFIYLYKDKKQATLKAMDITVFFLLGAAAFLLKSLHVLWLFWSLVLLLLIAAGVIGNLQYRLKNQVDAKRIWLLILRLGFIFFSITYIAAFIASLLHYLKHYLS